MPKVITKKSLTISEREAAIYRRNLDLERKKNKLFDRLQEYLDRYKFVYPTSHNHYSTVLKNMKASVDTLDEMLKDRQMNAYQQTKEEGKLL